MVGSKECRQFTDVATLALCVTMREKSCHMCPDRGLTGPGCMLLNPEDFKNKETCGPSDIFQLHASAGSSISAPSSDSKG